MKKTNNYSVLMSVYKSDKVEFFIQAVESLLNQTVQPEQIVLVRDGRVGDNLQNAIDKYVNDYCDLFTYLPIEQNGGLGNALRYGLSYCRNELVGRMDADDISVSDRFAKQLDFINDNPDIDIVGGNIAEFVNEQTEIVSYRIVPQTHEKIVACLKNRNPFNHMTVMFKKSTLEKVGSYESFYLFEDWYLWLKMYLSGAKFANINTVLVNVRVSDMATRRGGIKYYRSCVELLKYMKRHRIIGFWTYVKSCIVRFCGYVLLPNKLRELMYRKLLRKARQESN